MPTHSSLSSMPFSYAQETEGTSSFRIISNSGSSWLGPSIQATKAVTAAAELLPFPYIKNVLVTILTLLQAVEKIKKNREDLKELCESTMGIVAILDAQLSSFSNTAQTPLRGPCKELVELLCEVLLAVERLHITSQGFRGHVREFFKSSGITDEIMGYHRRIQELCSNLQHLSLQQQLTRTSKYTK
ncbi:hypothetical protein B0H19DRAFT_1086178 [Mycena capillaripes]|nr:hypothetical protein B0H19DRAFT_1086178 [Mycena capillaripes]